MKLWHVILLFCVSIFIIYIVNIPPTKIYDDADDKSFSNFKKYTYAELNNVIDSRLDGFIDDLIGIEGVYNYSKDFLGIGSDNKSRFISKVWDDNLNGPISKIIDDRVKILIDDMYITNNKCVENLKLKGVNVESFDVKLRTSLHENIHKNVLIFSSSAIDENIINTGIALGAGISVGILISSIMKSHWVTRVLSYGMDALVTIVVDSKLKKELKIKLRKNINDALYITLYGTEGLFVKIEKSIKEFHAFRRIAFSEVTKNK